MTLTPPLRPLSNVPFPRPPASTCALMTISSPPMSTRSIPILALPSLDVRTDVLSNCLRFCRRAGDFAFGYTDAILPVVSHFLWQPGISLQSLVGLPKGIHVSKENASVVKLNCERVYPAVDCQFPLTDNTASLRTFTALRAATNGLLRASLYIVASTRGASAWL